MLSPSPEFEANRIAMLPLNEARAELNRLLARAVGSNRAQIDVQALDFNARLVTALRMRGVRLWGDLG